MNLISLQKSDISEILYLEEKMYWQSGRWISLWKNEGKIWFRILLQEYIKKFPQGCFGYKNENDQIIGALLFLKINSINTVPYFHHFSEFFSSKGNIAYVSVFVVDQGNKGKEKIADKLYECLEEKAVLLDCNKSIAVIYSSSLEQRIIEKRGYQKYKKQYEWEIYPEIKVNSQIYYKNLI